MLSLKITTFVCALRYATAMGRMNRAMPCDGDSTREAPVDWLAYMSYKENSDDIRDMESKWNRRGSTSDVPLSPYMYVASLLDGKVTALVTGEELAGLLGYSCMELESNTSFWLDITHPDDAARVREAITRLLGGASLFEEYRVFREDGRLQWIRHAATPVTGDAGEVVKVVGLILPGEPPETIAEQAVCESQKQLGNILDSLLSVVAVIDRSGDIIMVNEAWKRVAREGGDPMMEHTGVGVNYFEVCRRSARRGCDEARTALDGLQDIVSGTSPDFEMEYECTAPGRERRWFTMRAAPMLGEQGGAVVSHLNTTRRKLAEEALRASEEEFRALVENVDAVVFRMDPGLRPITVAGSVGRISGRSAEELIGNPELWINSAHPDDRSAVLEFLQTIVNERRPGSLEVRAIKPDGEIVWVRAHVTPRFDEQGKLACYEGVYLDITELVEAHRHKERHATRVAALAQIARESASSLDLRTVIEVAVQNTAKALRCICGIAGIDPATKRPHIESMAIDESILNQTAQEVVAQINGALLEITRLESLQDLMQIFPEEVASRARELAGPIMTALLYTEGVPWGLMACARCQGGDKFDDVDSWFLTEVAADLSNALTNAGLYRRQARIAETLQRSLVPVVEEAPDLDIATCYLPAVGEAEIGGDFFDIIDFGDGRVGVVVGDVSGKGMEAAIHTAECKYMLRAFASLNPEPDSVVRLLNKALRTYIGEFTFVTLFYGIIDTRRHTMTYVNAGHEFPLILCTNHREVWELEVSGPALGIVGDWDYQLSSSLLEPDDFLMCYTDGVTDVPSNGERFGHDRLVETVARAYPEEPGHLLDHVIRAVREFGQGKQPDDQVVLVARPKV